MIERYHFGSIIIEGRNYTHDVEVLWSGEVLSWTKPESHHIDMASVQRAIEQNPQVIIIGTGEAGLARVTKEAQDEIKSRGIELIIAPTGQAVETFNQLAQEQKKVIGLFHLTC